MHIIDLVRTYEHTFPAVIWCVMRILIFYLVCYKKSFFFRECKPTQYFYWCAIQAEKKY